MSFYRLVALILLFLFSSLEGVAYIPLKGHLDAQVIKRAKERLSEVTSEELVIEVSSSSGRLKEVIDLAKEIYEAKQSKGLTLSVYIDDQAIGPAAVIPFLADQLYTSYFVSWGDISLGATDDIPTNILRNQVTSLIPKNRELLGIMARGMIDKNLTIIESDGTLRVTTDEKATLPIISPKGETLVVNHKQLSELGLVSQVYTVEEFRKKYLEESKSEPAESIKGLDEKLKEHIKYIDGEKNSVGYIKIDDKKTGINTSTWIYVKSALDYYKEKKPAFIILELNTPGGEVFASQKISDALKELDTIYEIPIIAYIDNWAISAGAMLAYSCRFITITKDAAMGAAQPVIQSSEGGMVAASEKVNSALRADFANRAGFFGRNQDIAEAMVDKDMILVYRHGKIVRLDSEDQIKKIGPDPDQIITTKGKLLTLKADDLMKYKVADIKLMPTKLAPITKEEEKKGEWPASKELLFEYPFFKKIPDTVIDVYQMDWKTHFFTMLAHPLVSSMLFLGLMLGFYVEINSPGFGVPGSMAFICLVLIVLSSFAFEAVGSLEIILIAIGIVLLGIDLFLIPSFGLMGSVGALFLVAGVMGLLIPGVESVDYDIETNSFNAAGEFVLERFAWLCATFVIGLVIIALLARYAMPHFTPFNRFVLKGSEEDYIAVEKSENLPQPGSQGKVSTMLKPGGKVEIEGKIYDAMSTGDFIEEGAKIEVTYLEGNNIMVSRVT